MRTYVSFRYVVPEHDAIKSLFGRLSYRPGDDRAEQLQSEINAFLLPGARHLGSILDLINTSGDFKDCGLQHRVKTIDSTLKKIQKYEGRVHPLPPGEMEDAGDIVIYHIYDIFGLRILTRSVAEIYDSVIPFFTSRFRLRRQYKDYISIPSPNKYQSVHMEVLDNRDRFERVFEVQLRTFDMHTMIQELPMRFPDERKP
jgi:hypothetical protein